jgi:NADH-quinone oxidoreductase subunit G
MGLSTPQYIKHTEKGKGDGFLITDDLAPNTTGCKLLNLTETSDIDLKKAIQNSKLVILLSDHLVDRGVLTEEDLEDTFLIMMATNSSETTKAADLVIPITTAAEHAASYVNVDTRIQRTLPAKETKYTNRRLELEMSEGRLDRYGTNFDNWVTEDNKIDCLPLWTFITKVAEEAGMKLSYESGRQIMEEISDTMEVFSGVSYPQMDENGGIPLRAETSAEKTAGQKT